ncbi:hypothetical protein DM860_017937 [Cuscuta australis]|uniref:Uncharacterized protein n=1 Tax=Cuscuta australis TaxID=267555 RepID=A0A328DZK4_9ASTE|nr:hypothetical protein DM860_017937 [Cuscuta australis]
MPAIVASRSGGHGRVLPHAHPCDIGGHDHVFTCSLGECQLLLHHGAGGMVSEGPALAHTHPGHLVRLVSHPLATRTGARANAVRVGGGNQCWASVVGMPAFRTRMVGYFVLAELTLGWLDFGLILALAAKTCHESLFNMGWHSINAMALLVVHYLLAFSQKVLAHWLLLSTQGSLVHYWLHLHFCDCVSLCMTAYDVLSSLSILACQGALRNDTWLILPVVICLSQRLSHACPPMHTARHGDFSSSKSRPILGIHPTTPSSPVEDVVDQSSYVAFGPRCRELCLGSYFRNGTCLSLRLDQIGLMFPKYPNK